MKHLIGVAIAALVSAACGSGGTAPGASPARVAVVQAAPRAGAVTLTINGSHAGGSVPAGTVSPFVSVPIGSPTLGIAPASGSAVAVTGTKVIVGVSYDLLVLDSAGALIAQLLPDITYDTLSGVAHVRLVHAASTLASDSINMYVTPPGTPSDSALHDSATALMSSLGFPKNTGYVQIPPGTYEVRITRAQFPDTVLARLTGLDVAAKQGRTVVVADASSGGITVLLVNDLLLIEPQTLSYTNP